MDRSNTPAEQVAYVQWSTLGIAKHVVRPLVRRGIGPRLAEQMPDQKLRRIRGIGPTAIVKIREHIAAPICECCGRPL